MNFPPYTIIPHCTAIRHYIVRVCHLYKRLSVHRLSVRPPTRPTDCLYVYVHIYMPESFECQNLFIILTLYLLYFLLFCSFHLYSGVHCTGTYQVVRLKNTHIHVYTNNVFICLSLCHLCYFSHLLNHPLSFYHTFCPPDQMLGYWPVGTFHQDWVLCCLCDITWLSVWYCNCLWNRVSIVGTLVMMW